MSRPRRATKKTKVDPSGAIILPEWAPPLNSFVYTLFGTTKGTTKVDKFYCGKITDINSVNDDCVEYTIRYEDETVNNTKIWREALEKQWRPTTIEDFEKHRASNIDSSMQVVQPTMGVAEIRSIMKPDLDEMQRTFIDKLKEFNDKLQDIKPLKSLAGDMEGEDVMAWYQSSPEYRNQHVQDEMLVGSMCPKGGDSGKSRATTRMMCVNYKNLNSICKSKQLNVSHKLFLSKDAVFVHFKQFAKAEVRMKSIAQAIKFLKLKSICSKCAKSLDFTSFTNIQNKKNVCCCCLVKLKSDSGTASEQSLALCCNCLENSTKIQDKVENIMKDAFGPLLKMFDGSYSSNQTIPGTMVTPDGVITIKMRGIVFKFIIEMDQCQHKASSYKPEEENNKMIKQIVGVIKSASPQRVKVLAIRFNPNSKWTGHDNITSTLYGTIERIIILRQWLMWYIINGDHVRDLIIMYLWYDSPNKAKLLCPNFDGFTMQYHAPKSNLVDWQYNITPWEYNNEKLKLVKDNAQPVDIKWKFETQDATYPSIIKVKLIES